MRATFGGAKYVTGQFGRNTVGEEKDVVHHADMHKGFYRLYEVMQDSVLSTMAEQVTHEPLGLQTDVIVVGHSLGGALATLAVGTRCRGE